MSLLPNSFLALQREADKAGRKPRFHGNGFVQLYLTDEYRLHVFDPLLLEGLVENATIHDHRWDMRSTVLLGSVRHVMYYAYPAGDGPWSIYLANPDPKRPLERALPGRYKVTEIGNHTLKAGSAYDFRRRWFHESGAEELTMTIIKKGNDDGAPARVIAPWDETPDHAFAAQPDEADLWASIHEAYRRF